MVVSILPKRVTDLRPPGAAAVNERIVRLVLLLHVTGCNHVHGSATACKVLLYSRAHAVASPHELLKVDTLRRLGNVYQLSDSRFRILQIALRRQAC